MTPLPSVPWPLRRRALAPLLAACASPLPPANRLPPLVFGHGNDLRPARIAEADRSADAIVSITRPRAYFGIPRDTILWDGQPAPGIPPGVAGVADSKILPTDGASRPVVGEFSSGVISERIVGRVWPARDNHLTVLELHE